MNRDLQIKQNFPKNSDRKGPSFVELFVDIDALVHLLFFISQNK
jgi:hypothetical protein